MMVICTIMVVSMHFLSPADVKGKILSSSVNNYLVDFSEDAKKREFEGNYSEKIVNKKDCVILKGDK